MVVISPPPQPNKYEEKNEEVPEGTPLKMRGTEQKRYGE
jgi:hypothetical protein